MPTNFPTGLDTFTEPPDPVNTPLGNVTYDHNLHHKNLGDALEAVEAKTGLNGSTVVTSLDYRVARQVAVLKSHGTVVNPTTITLVDGGIHDLILGAANVTLTFAGATSGVGHELTLIVRQDGTGGRAITWPASVLWRNNAAPVLSTAPNTIDVFKFITVDTGVTWHAERWQPGNVLPESGASPTVIGAVPVWDTSSLAYIGRVLDARDAPDKINVQTISGSQNLNYSVGTVKDLTLTVSGATLTPTGAPTGGALGSAGQMTVILRQDATGSRTVIWPASVKWESGTAPVLSTAPNAVDVITLLTVDTGVTWLGFYSGKDLR